MYAKLAKRTCKINTQYESKPRFMLYSDQERRVKISLLFKLIEIR